MESKVARCPSWFNIVEIRKKNDDLDWVQGPRAHLSKVDALSITALDALVDHLCRKGVVSPIKYEHEGGKKRKRAGANPLSLQFYTCDISSKVLGMAIYAGFFPFGSEFAYEDKPLCERGVLNLELAGMNRMPTAEGLSTQLPRVHTKSLD